MSKPIPTKPGAKPAQKTYVSNGRVLESPPLGAQIRGFADSVSLFFGLYFTTLFSFDPLAAARTSAYNINNRERDGTRTGRGFFGGEGSGGGGGGGRGGGSWPGSGGGGGGGGRKVGTVDQIREPECKSCG
ncbi:MAG: hypothetical protein MMC33_010835 [Icmadophila ericetorum]|nr:hypothetical protein [Icmadophila ericetorum]